MHDQRFFTSISHSKVGIDAFPAPSVPVATVSGNQGCPQDVLGMRALWRAVITQALMDAASNSSKVADKVERARARAWFSLSNPDFLTVCAYADLEPSYVVQKAKEALKRECQWRGKKNQKQSPKKKKNTPSAPHPSLTLNDASTKQQRG